MRHFLTGIATLAIVTVLGSAPAMAQVTAVLVKSNASISIKDTNSFHPTKYSFDGPVIEGDLGGAIFGDAASYSSTSKLAPNYVEFKNGNVSGGQISQVTSQTIVDITFKNDSADPVQPILTSSIIPAGLGLFVGSKECLDGLKSCSPGMDFAGNTNTFQSFMPNSGIKLAGSAFDFEISAGNVVLASIKGSIDLVRDTLTGKNVIVTDLVDAAAILHNFAVVSAPDSPSNYAVKWDATDLLIDFGVGGKLAPGASSTLSYSTTVSTYSLSSCVGGTGDAGACLEAYGAFGDPIGRGGGIQPGVMNGPTLLGMKSSLPGLDAVDPSGINFGSFRFEFPEFKDGVLGFDLIGKGGVPEPGTWAMMVAGFGLMGAALRRRRQPVSVMRAI